jgi:ABC-type sugar transport system substrate-binding protein
MHLTGARAKWRSAVGVLVVAAALTVGACGGDDDDAGTQQPAATAAATTEQPAATTTAEALVPAPETSPPTEIPITEPLKSKPPKQDLTWLACELPTCQGALSQGQKEATAALGWNLKTVPYKVLSAAAGMQQAINGNPDFITITGIPPAAFKAQAKTAVEKDIGIIDAFDTTEANREENGLSAMVSGPATVKKEAEQIGNWMINDSGGKAKVVMVSIGDYPILNMERDELKAALAKCSGCSFDELPVTVDDLGAGKVGAKVVGILQSKPDTNYVEFAFDDLVRGVPQVLKTAGVADKVKLTGVVVSEVVAKGIVDGDIAAWVAQPNLYTSWAMVDAAARLAVGQPLAQAQQDGLIPTWVVDKAETAQKLLDDSQGGWLGPEGFQEQFKKLWGVS